MFSGLGSTPVLAAMPPSPICNAGDQVILEAVQLSESCMVTGNLTIGTGGRMVVDFTGNPDKVFAVAGNVTMTGNAVLQVIGGTFAIMQDYNRQREIQSFDTASLLFRDTRVVVNQGPGLKYMLYNAFG
ncbi:MAG: hypothetical protein U1F76_32710, partial [Candidatus Competibacteraceae bacterium]